MCVCVCVCVCVCMCVCVYACVCACVRERGIERESNEVTENSLLWKFWKEEWGSATSLTATSFLLKLIFYSALYKKNIQKMTSHERFRYSYKFLSFKMAIGAVRNNDIKFSIKKTSHIYSFPPPHCHILSQIFLL